MDTKPQQFPPAIEQRPTASPEEILRRILLILQILETKIKIVHVLLLITVTVLTLSGV